MNCDCKYQERRRLTTASGGFQVKMQCLQCGKRGQARKVQAGDEKLPEVDKDLWRKSWEEKSEAIQRAKEQESSAIKQKMQWEYAEYLKTPEWREMRQKVLIRDNYLCQYCLSARADQVHHKTYIYKKAGHEAAFELVSLCKKCHELHHGVLQNANT